MSARADKKLVGRLVSYVTAVSKDDFHNLRSAYARISKPSEELFMTAAEKLIQQGLRQGRQEGRQKGRREGRQEGRASVLVTLLQQRFGTLPATVTARVHAGTASDLDVWTRRVLTAATLEEVLLLDA
ncbi:MAG: hypothetical protein ABIP94_14640 [Planctomycetota bacterium]